MIKKPRKIFLFFSFLSAFFLKAGFVCATEITYPSLFGFSVNDTSSLPDYIKYFFGVGSGMAITAAVIAITFGGIYYLVDYGRGKTASEGKEWVKAGLLGLLITLCAYLILYTINPNLTILKLDGLPQIFSGENPLFSNNAGNPEVKIYKKIPVGALAENLLTKTIDCYDYDLNGNPIEGYKIKTDAGKEIYGPTYMEHDRVDCFAKLADAVDKKSNIINKLAIKIKELMEKCTCSGNCNSPCLDDKDEKEACGQPEECVGPCSECQGTAICESIKKENIKDDYGSGLSYPNDNTCDKATRNKIEGNEDPKKDTSGILVYSESGETCKSEGEKYFGLKEFRPDPKFDDNYEKIKEYVEIQPKPKVNDKELAIFSTGNCKVCDACGNGECNPADKNYKTCIQQKQKCEGEKNTCDKERKTCLKKNSPWYKLRLIDQLTYLKGKMEEIKTNIEEDKKQVENAVSDINNCYLVRSAAEFYKIKEQTSEETTLISVTNNYVDKETSDPIGSKYCKGFNYENSSCFEYCSNICPDISEDNKIYDCYKTADSEIKAQKCFNEKKCTLGDFKGTFKECIGSCQKNCSAICEKKYAKCSDQYNECSTMCKNNSQCLLDNENQCLLNSQAFLTCANESIDQGTAQHCLENAYLCQYGSNQYAGYPECLKGSSALGEYYAASYIAQNNDKQLCPDPFKIAKDNIYTCLQQNPETAKCPASSRCPSTTETASANACVCTSLDNTFNFELPPKIEDTKPMCVNNKKEQVAVEEDTYSTNGGEKEYVANGIAKITVTEVNQTRSVKLKATNLVGQNVQTTLLTKIHSHFIAKMNGGKKIQKEKDPIQLAGIGLVLWQMKFLWGRLLMNQSCGQKTFQKNLKKY